MFCVETASCSSVPIQPRTILPHTETLPSVWRNTIQNMKQSTHSVNIKGPTCFLLRTTHKLLCRRHCLQWSDSSVSKMYRFSKKTCWVGFTPFLIHKYVSYLISVFWKEAEKEVVDQDQSLANGNSLSENHAAGLIWSILVKWYSRLYLEIKGAEQQGYINQTH